MKILLTALTYVSLIYTTSQKHNQSMDQKKCEVFSVQDIQKTSSRYLNFLREKIGQMEQNKEFDSYLVEDIEIDKTKDVSNKTILVWDLGGSYFKLGYVHIGIKDGKITCEIDTPKEIGYPETTEATRGINWEDWAVDKMFDFIEESRKLPDASSLIVSYPLKYDGKGDARVERFTKFFCFNNKVQENETIINSITRSIEAKFLERYSLKETEYKRLIFNSEDDEEIKNRLRVKTVLNDSVANYFSSKYKDSEFSIGIILGTGTNAAFPVTINKHQYVFNSEWGSFRPEDITYLPKEIELFENMCAKSENVNFLDVIAANGCKFELVNSFFPDKTPITKLNYETIINDEEDPRSSIYKIVMKRSKQLIAALTNAVIKLNENKDCLIITNGSGFDDKEDCKNFVEELKQLKKNEDGKIELFKDRGLTLKGSALYTFYYLLN